jgi:general secretion pathway protein K
MIARARRDRRDGSALIVALLVVSLLTLMAIEFAYEVRVDASLSNNALLELKAEYAARSAVNIVKAQLSADWHDERSDATQKSDTPYEDWAQWMIWPQGPADRVLEPLEIGDATVYMTVSDEDGKINVNRLVSGAVDPQGSQAPTDIGLDLITRDAIMALYQEVLEGVDQNILRELVYILADWIDVDDMPRTQYAAERDYYQLLDVPYVCKNGPLNSIDEMLLLRGYNEKVVSGVGNYPGLGAYLTAYGGMDGKINVNTASESVLRAVFNKSGIADSIISKRQEVPYTEGDLVVRNSNPNVPVPPISAKGKARSEVFSCDCLVEIGDYQKLIRCVIMRSLEGPSRPIFKVMMWKELG